MNPGEPDVIEQVPKGTGNPMQPESGTYGRVAETDRLKQALDLPGGPGGGPAQPSSPPAPGLPQGAQMPATPGGVPDVLMAPTSRPDVAPSTPLQSARPAGSPSAVTGAQRRLSILSALSTSDEVSDETREWAKLVLDKLAQRQA